MSLPSTGNYGNRRRNFDMKHHHWYGKLPDNSTIRIPPEVTAVHGISDEDVKDKPKDRVVQR